METLQAFIIIGLAALIHASFQLSVSVFTLLSGHAIGSKRSHGSLMRLGGGFIIGVGLMTLLLLGTTAFALASSVFLSDLPAVWAVSSGLLLGLGVAVCSFYYRREPGTTLWLPRGIAAFLSDRTKATKNSAEAFSLGMTSVIAEILFVAVPIFVSALLIVQLPTVLQLAAALLYTLVSLLSLLIVSVLVGGGHKLSRIQQWREDNKRFLQFAAGTGLILLGFYLYVEKVVTAAVSVTGGMQ